MLKFQAFVFGFFVCLFFLQKTSHLFRGTINQKTLQQVQISTAFINCLLAHSLGQNSSHIAANEDLMLLWHQHIYMWNGKMHELQKNN